jgi:methyl-accepting chemotaxis protein
MKFQNTIKARLLIYIIGSVIIIYGSVVSYIQLRFKEASFQTAQKYAESYSYQIAKDIESDMDKHIAICRNVQLSMDLYKQLPEGMAQAFYNKLLYALIEKHPAYLSTWVSWELNKTEKGYTEKDGRDRMTYVRTKDNQIDFLKERLTHEKHNLYATLKENKQDAVVEPYPFVYTGQTDTILMTSICMPVIIDNQFWGLAGVDINLNYYKEFIKKLKVFENGYAFLLSNEGYYLGHPDSTVIGQTFSDVNPEEDVFTKLLSTLKKENLFIFGLFTRKPMTNYTYYLHQLK